MNKLKPIILLILSVIFLQNCKKDTVTATTDSTAPLQAVVNDVTWLPDTLSASINYDATTKTKTFSCEGTFSQKRINVAIKLSNATNDAGFTLGTYTVDDTDNVVMTYSTQQKDGGGNYVFVQTGTVDPGSGTVKITAVDATKKTITGTFSMIVRTRIYDQDGNVISTDINTVSDGIFNSLPYTFSSTLQ